LNGFSTKIPGLTHVKKPVISLTGSSERGIRSHPDVSCQSVIPVKLPALNSEHLFLKIDYNLTITALDILIL
jgi:hypothetical protein